MNQLDCYGVYVIRENVKRRYYVGATTRSFRKRFKQHRRLLNARRHPSWQLQSGWFIHGEPRFWFIPAILVGSHAGQSDQQTTEQNRVFLTEYFVYLALVEAFGKSSIYNKVSMPLDGFPAPYLSDIRNRAYNWVVYESRSRLPEVLWSVGSGPAWVE
jgi:hypothetical protein